ncbi:hypothetical protein MKQ68_23015 [Chitinophaga horti]|uniref:DUF4397 domain-containing protein n=1 Tax=Chitinophaga horti TaxID=2920382 RepID=A0ABY6J0L0_9BACT|nr:hypothetical protein [Chitinophaga horti]UYQ92956.1 hypothetical protein MKQ68_23015 [Chitinophaga horti]
MNTLLRPLPAILAGIFTCFIYSCAADDSMGSNCTETELGLTIANQPRQLKLVSSTMIRITNVEGSYKLLSLEGVTDSIKVIANIKSGRYITYGDLQNDSIPVGKYTYSSRGTDTTGRILVGLGRSDAYHFAITDSAMIEITSVDPVNRTVTGKYYVETRSPQLTASGYFRKLCFQSLK